MFTIDAYIRAKQVGGRYVGEAGSANTLKTYATCLTQAERMLDKPIAEFTSSDADTLMEIMQEEDYANDSKALILSALRGAFTWAIGNGLYHDAHPFDGIRNPPKRRKLPTILSKEEVDRFFLVLYDNPKYSLFFKLMYFGGLRIGEVTKLLKADRVDGGILVRGKGDRQRIANLPASVCAELDSFIKSHNKTKYVFYNEATNKGPISAVYPYHVFHDTKRSAGLASELHPHNLRHSAATHFYAATNDIALTQKLLGHARVETTLLYAQITNEQLSSAHRAVFGD
jgi:site-specific recombinase XerD